MEKKEYQVPQHLIEFFKKRAEYMAEKRKKNGERNPDYPQGNE
jgi:hypothetical protein